MEAAPRSQARRVGGDGARVFRPENHQCPWRLHRGAALHDWPRAGVKIKPPGRVRSGGFVIGGGYLLSHFRSTIGVAGFNFSVRNGKRWSPRAIATLVSLHSQCLRDTGRYKVKKSVDILPQRGGEIITRFACPVGAEYVTIILAVMCATVMAADAAAFPLFETASSGGLATRKGFG